MYLPHNGSDLVLCWRCLILAPDMGDLTKNFSLKEFDCRCGCAMPKGARVAVSALAAQLQVLRDYLKKPIIVTSGYRCVAHNYSVGGAARSFHLAGMAADVVINGVSPAHLGALIQEMIHSAAMAEGGLKAYSSFVHYDIRGVLTLF